MMAIHAAEPLSAVTYFGKTISFIEENFGYIPSFPN